MFISSGGLSKISPLQGSELSYGSDVLIGGGNGELKQDGVEDAAVGIGNFENTVLRIVEKIISVVVCIALEGIKVFMESSFKELVGFRFNVSG